MMMMMMMMMMATMMMMMMMMMMKMGRYESNMASLVQWRILGFRLLELTRVSEGFEGF